MISKTEKNQNGVALITLLFFVLISTVFISAAVIISAVNSQSVASVEQGMSTSRLAESVLEDALLRLLRSPNYAGGSFNLEGGSATVNVTGDGTKEVEVTILNGNYKRSFEAVVEFMETEMNIVSWKEVF